MKMRSFHMYASINAVAVSVFLCKKCSFNNYAFIYWFQMSGYAPMRLVFFYNRRHFEGTVV